MSTPSNILKIGELTFPASQSTEEKLKHLLNYAVLAPSSHNTQPWQFTIENDTIYFKADRTRSLSIADPEGRELIISCGTALFNLRIALHHFGYAGKIVTLPDPNLPDLLACIQLGNPRSESDEEHMLFKAIQRRHTNRGYFEDWDVPESLLDWLKGDASAEGVWMYKVKCKTKRQLIGDLVVQADHLQMENPDFRRELATWMRKGDSSSHDGIPSYAFGVSQYLDFATPIFALVMRTFNLGNTIAERSRQLVTQSPVIIVLGTSSDTSADWLKVGQALERILLRAETVGLSASFLNQAIQVPSVRNQVSKITEELGLPQIILRMGFGSQVKPTPRRAVDEVVN
jgi:Putative TM nitroreductase